MDHLYKSHSVLSTTDQLLHYLQGLEAPLSVPAELPAWRGFLQMEEHLTFSSPPPEVQVAPCSLSSSLSFIISFTLPRYNLDSILERRDITLPKKDPSSQSYVFFQYSCMDVRVEL